LAVAFRYLFGILVSGLGRVVGVFRQPARFTGSSLVASQPIVSPLLTVFFAMLFVLAS
jgi:hypothetical protein